MHIDADRSHSTQRSEHELTHCGACVGLREQDERAARLAVIEERLADIGERAEQVIIEDQKKNAVFWQGVRANPPSALALVGTTAFQVPCSCDEASAFRVCLPTRGC